MYEFLKKIFPKDYIKANELFDSKDIEANFKVLLLTRFNNLFLYFIYFYFSICLVWSLRFLLGYSNSGVPPSIAFSFFILLAVYTYISYKVKRIRFLNPTKDDKEFYKENPKYKEKIKKILNIKE